MHHPGITANVMLPATSSLHILPPSIIHIHQIIMPQPEVSHPGVHTFPPEIFTSFNVPGDHCTPRPITSHSNNPCFLISWHWKCNFNLCILWQQVICLNMGPWALTCFNLPTWWWTHRHASWNHWPWNHTPWSHIVALYCWCVRIEAQYGSNYKL